MNLRPGAPAQVHHDAREGFIQWRILRAKSGDARPVTQRFIERAPESDGAIFSGVVVVYV